MRAEGTSRRSRFARRPCAPFVRMSGVVARSRAQPGRVAVHGSRRARSGPQRPGLRCRAVADGTSYGFRLNKPRSRASRAFSAAIGHLPLGSGLRIRHRAADRASRQRASRSVAPSTSSEVASSPTSSVSASPSSHPSGQMGCCGLRDGFGASPVGSRTPERVSHTSSRRRADPRPPSADLYHWSPSKKGGDGNAGQSPA